MNESDGIAAILAEWRRSDLDRRRVLLMEVGLIERRWGIGYHDRQPEITRLLKSLEQDQESIDTTS